MRPSQATRSEIMCGEWRGGFAGVGAVETPAGRLPISAPVAAGGPGEGVNPSSLLVAAANGCYLLTLAALLEHHGVEAVRISLETEGVFRNRLPPDLRAIVHRPTIALTTVGAGRTATVDACLTRAKEACVVTRAMPNVEFTVESTIVVETPSAETAQAAERLRWPQKGEKHD